MTELDAILKRFENRIEERKPQAEEDEKQRQEELRQSYLKRTSRSDLKP